MKSQSLKLFAIAFVLGLVTIFASASAASAQTLTFAAPFDFHIGKEKLSAGKYELQKMTFNSYLLRNSETRLARIIVIDGTASNLKSSEAERLVFNRYGETYFLRGIFDRRGADGKQIGESNYEKRVRKGAAGEEEQLAGEKPEKILVKLSK